MKIKFFLLLIFIIIGKLAFAERTIKVFDDCLYLSNVLNTTSKLEIMCGLMPGQSKFIPKESINNFFVRNRINASINHDLVVIREGVIVDEGYVASLVHTELTNAYPDIRFDVARVSFGSPLYAKDVDFVEVSVADLKGFGSGYVSIKTDMETRKIYVFVKAYKDVYVTTTSVRRGDTLAENVELQEMDVTNLRDEPLLDLSEMIASRSISRGRVITENIVQPKPNALKGDKVKLVYSSNGIVVETTAYLETDADIGSIVNVKNSYSGSIISAKYIGNNVAVVP